MPKVKLLNRGNTSTNDIPCFPYYCMDCFGECAAADGLCPTDSGGCPIDCPIYVNKS